MVGKVEFKLTGEGFERLLKELGPVPAGKLDQNARRGDSDDCCGGEGGGA